MRHDMLSAMMSAFPKPELQTESIVNSNYRSALKRLAYKNHEREESKSDERPLCTNR